MSETVVAIGEPLEKKILHQARKLPYFSFINDESTDTSTTKSLGIDPFNTSISIMHL